MAQKNTLLLRFISSDAREMGGHGTMINGTSLQKHFIESNSSFCMKFRIEMRNMRGRF